MFPANWARDSEGNGINTIKRTFKTKNTKSTIKNDSLLINSIDKSRPAKLKYGTKRTLAGSINGCLEAG
jgi:hypothetical protein